MEIKICLELKKYIVQKHSKTVNILGLMILVMELHRAREAFDKRIALGRSLAK